MEKTVITEIPARIVATRVKGTSKAGKDCDFITITVESNDGEIRLYPDSKNINTKITVKLIEKGLY